MINHTSINTLLDNVQKAQHELDTQREGLKTEIYTMFANDERKSILATDNSKALNYFVGRETNDGRVEDWIKSVVSAYPEHAEENLPPALDEDQALVNKFPDIKVVFASGETASLEDIIEIENIMLFLQEFFPNYDQFSIVP